MSNKNITENSYPYQNDEIENIRLKLLSQLYDQKSIDWLSRFLKPGQTVLELGVGQGNIAKGIMHIIGQTGVYTGIELNHCQAEHARSTLRAFNNVDIQEKNASEAIQSFGDEKFDVIYFRWFLWVIAAKDWMNFLADLFQLLNPGGYMIAEEADMKAIKTEPLAKGFDSYKKITELRCEQGGQPLCLGPAMGDIFKKVKPNCQVSTGDPFQPIANTFKTKLLPYYSAYSAEQSIKAAGLSDEQFKGLLDQLYHMAEDDSITLYATKNFYTAATLGHIDVAVK